MENYTVVLDFCKWPYSPYCLEEVFSELHTQRIAPVQHL